MSAKMSLNKGQVPINIWTTDVESAALDQLINVSKLPILHSHIAVMPDVHMGIGCTVGSVIATKNAIIPAAVGVDIGCGMVAVQTSLQASDLPDNLKAIRDDIESVVPVGFAVRSGHSIKSRAAKQLELGLEQILEKHPKIGNHGRLNQKWAASIGTLGGGNHFIELCLDEDDHIWIMLHSGSRGGGNLIGQYFIAEAKEYAHRKGHILPHADLAYLETGDQLFDDYWQALTWAQEFARLNRAEMLSDVIAVLRRHLPAFSLIEQAINCHHNYASLELYQGAEVFITRKGAIRAGKGELGIIPGSMGTRSYIVRGLGNESSFCSCSHGAGRRMSRAAAKRQFSISDIEAQTRGVECRKDIGVADEAPMAYKDIDQVMENQSDLVEIVATLKQVLCVKG